MPFANSTTVQNKVGIGISRFLLRRVVLSLVAMCVCMNGCSASCTTNGMPNRGGPVTEGPKANAERGGMPADWSHGTGQPGSAKWNKKWDYEVSPMPNPSTRGAFAHR